MPEDNTQTTTNTNPMPTPAPVSDDDVIVTPDGPLADALEAAASKIEGDSDGVIAEVAGKIAEAQNILIALSSDPSVDELSAAIGLSLYLDKLGKRATAIYSGSTPNALEFLKPEETFESTADSLQDFVIALNKEKADHLRYKLDGDYVKIYITPYKSRIDSDDLDYSYGDFNIDLVLALDVANGIDLDAALREHGRIMHDAVIVNITTGAPGKLGEIEWSDKAASSVSEMAAKLSYGIKGDAVIEKEEATAFLTGIVAATSRFSNAKTTPDTMKIASRLMESGADQQLIAKNITPEVENEIMSYATVGPKKSAASDDPTNLAIEHEGGEEIPSDISEEKKEDVLDAPKVPEAPEVSETPETPATPDVPAEAPEESLDDDLKAAEASLAGAGAETTPTPAAAPLRIEDSPVAETPATESTSSAETVLPPVSLPQVDFSAPSTTPEPSVLSGIGNPEARTPEESQSESETVIEPNPDFSAEPPLGEENKYGQMLEEALAEAGEPTQPTAIVNPPEEAGNPAASLAPSVPTAPEINGVPEINYMPLPGDEVLPPPPAPPVNFDDTPMPAPEAQTETTAAPEVANPMDLGGQPVMQDQVYTEQASNPSAFKIPGM